MPETSRKSVYIQKQTNKKVRTAFAEKLGEQANNVRKREVARRNDAFNLMKLGEMRCIERFVAKNAIDAEHFRRPKAILRKFVELASGDRCCVRS